LAILKNRSPHSAYFVKNLRSEDAKATLSVAFVGLPVALAFFIGAVSLITLFSLRITNPTFIQVHEQETIESVTEREELSRLISPIFTKEIQSWGSTIHRWADEYALDPNMIALVMQIESCGDPDAQSSAGAMGLFQVMPFHFSDTEDPMEPDTNARRGLAYLARAFEISGGNPGLAMAGYNGGHSVINWASSLWAEETQRYVYWASGIVKDIERGAKDSDRLEEWLAAGGASLCHQASMALGL
jgi:soluble lytic murein transglycosylase-like protein